MLLRIFRTTPLHLYSSACSRPVLMYLAPLTLLSLFLMAYLKGDLSTMWHEPFSNKNNEKTEEKNKYQIIYVLVMINSF